MQLKIEMNKINTRRTVGYVARCISLLTIAGCGNQRNDFTLVVILFN